MSAQFKGVQGYVVEFVGTSGEGAKLAKIRLAGGIEVVEPIASEIVEGALVIRRPCCGCRHTGWMLLWRFREENRDLHEGNIYVECLRCWSGWD